MTPRLAAASFARRAASPRCAGEKVPTPAAIPDPSSTFVWDASSTTMITNVDHKIIKSLSEVYPFNPYGDYRNKHVAGIAYKSSLIAIGWNHKKTHSLSLRFRKNPDAIFIHAELDAIKNFLKTHNSYNLTASTLYVISYRFDGDLRNSRPCEGCAKAIAAFDIKRVVYSTGRIELPFDDR